MVANPFRTFPKKPWNDDSPVNTDKQWLQPWFQSGAGFRPSTVTIDCKESFRLSIRQATVSIGSNGSTVKYNVVLGGPCVSCSIVPFWHGLPASVRIIPNWVSPVSSIWKACRGLPQEASELHLEGLPQKKLPGVSFFLVNGPIFTRQTIATRRFFEAVVP